jgi:cell wall-associated NlpC family hydrolase
MIPRSQYDRRAHRYLVDYNPKGWTLEDGLFCFSTIWLLHKLEFGVELPRDPGWQATDLADQESQIITALTDPLSGWTEHKGVPVFGDGVLLDVDGHSGHIGVAVGANVMIHAYCTDFATGTEGRVALSWIKPELAQFDAWCNPRFYRHEVMRHV